MSWFVYYSLQMLTIAFHWILYFVCFKKKLSFVINDADYNVTEQWLVGNSTQIHTCCY